MRQKEEDKQDGKGFYWSDNGRGRGCWLLGGGEEMKVERVPSRSWKINDQLHLSNGLTMRSHCPKEDNDPESCFAKFVVNMLFEMDRISVFMYSAE